METRSYWNFSHSADILFLKPACSIQPCMWFMEDPSQFSVGQTAPVPSWWNHLQGWITVWECCMHALEKGCLTFRKYNSVLTDCYVMVEISWISCLNNFWPPGTANNHFTYQSLGNIDATPDTLVGWVVREALNSGKVLWKFLQSLLVTSPAMWDMCDHVTQINNLSLLLLNCWIALLIRARP